jgi:hypothetical protein
LWIDQENSWHAAEFKPVNILLVLRCNQGSNIRATNEWQILTLPVTFERIWTIWPQRDDFNVSSDEFGVILAQLRQMCFAVWSGKTPH